MDSRTFGRINVTLPVLADGYLSDVSSLESGRGTVQEFRYADADLRDLDLAHAHLITGRVTNLRVARVRLDEVRVDSVEFNGCDFGTLQWANRKLSRVVFRNCKIMGANFAGLTLDNVLFDNCRFDYSTFEQIRAAGPVAFSSCVLSEATFTACDLSRVVLDSCTLRATEFRVGTYKEMDLRGNELTTVCGVSVSLLVPEVAARNRVECAPVLDTPVGGSANSPHWSRCCKPSRAADPRYPMAGAMPDVQP